MRAEHVLVVPLRKSLAALERSEPSLGVAGGGDSVDAVRAWHTSGPGGDGGSVCIEAATATRVRALEDRSSYSFSLVSAAWAAIDAPGA